MMPTIINKFDDQTECIAKFKDGDKVITIDGKTGIIYDSMLKYTMIADDISYPMDRVINRYRIWTYQLDNSGKDYEEDDLKLFDYMDVI